MSGAHFIINKDDNDGQLRCTILTHMARMVRPRRPIYDLSRVQGSLYTARYQYISTCPVWYRMGLMHIPKTNTDCA